MHSYTQALYSASGLELLLYSCKESPSQYTVKGGANQPSIPGLVLLRAHPRAPPTHEARAAGCVPCAAPPEHALAGAPCCERKHAGTKIRYGTRRRHACCEGQHAGANSVYCMCMWRACCEEQHASRACTTYSAAHVPCAACATTRTYGFDVFKRVHTYRTGRQSRMHTYRTGCQSRMLATYTSLCLLVYGYVGPCQQQVPPLG